MAFSAGAALAFSAGAALAFSAGAAEAFSAGAAAAFSAGAAESVSGTLASDSVLPFGVPRLLLLSKPLRSRMRSAAASCSMPRMRDKLSICASAWAWGHFKSAANDAGVLAPFREATDIFITPGYRFRIVDALMTNFHLPRSTLFMLVSAFCGRGRMLAAYGEAIDSGYRFYSYGDASLLFRAGDSA